MLCCVLETILNLPSGKQNLKLFSSFSSFMQIDSLAWSKKRATVMLCE